MSSIVEVAHEPCICVKFQHGFGALRHVDGAAWGSRRLLGREARNMFATEALGPRQAHLQR